MMCGSNEPRQLTASKRRRLLLAGLFWTVTGAALLTFGTIWAIQARTTMTALILPVALGLGLAKSEWILTRVTHRIVERVRTGRADRWIGGFMPLHLWLAIALMILVGRLLRLYVLPRDMVGLIYVAVGMALLLSGRVIWARWFSRNAEMASQATDPDPGA
jgi:hypothetical protein